MTSASSSPAAVRPLGRLEASVPAAAWSLAAALLGFFVVTLDAVIVNVALPDIRRELAGGMSGLQWVADGYTLMFAAFLLSAGSVADRAGARRAFGAGLTVFMAVPGPAVSDQQWDRVGLSLGLVRDDGIGSGRAHTFSRAVARCGRGAAASWALLARRCRDA